MPVTPCLRHSSSTAIVSQLPPDITLRDLGAQAVAVAAGGVAFEGSWQTCYAANFHSRIASRVGHLSNRDAARLARDVVHRDLAHVVLAHLSENCNDHGIAHRTMT